MKTLTTIESMQEQSRTWRKDDQRIGYVPTMGALHAGHTALFDAARAQCDQLVLSIFVNPSQFGPGEDFDAYPRTQDDDIALAKKHGVDAVFTPSAAELYPQTFRTWIDVHEITEGLCGIDRPGHFRGVATIVCKLFNIIRPNTAFFGEKDYQQLKTIERMVTDLHIDTNICAVPTVREEDGLALSSRNRYLSREERTLAALIPEALQEVANLASLEQSPQTLQTHIYKRLSAAGIDIEYAEVVDAQTLEPLNALTSPARCCIACRIGNTRLIDNIALC